MWVILGHLVCLWQVVFKLKMVKVKQCESCGLSSSSTTFKNMKAFNNHFESHQTNLKCHEKDCDKTFATRAKLKWHRKTVHATPVNCQCCNKVFKTDALLKNHLKKIFQGKLPILWERISKSTELEKAPSFPWKYRGVQMWWLWKNLTNSGRGIKWLMWRETNMVKTYFNV